MTNYTKKVPKLRFPGYNATWKKTDLINLAKFEQGVQVDLEKQFNTPAPGRVKFLRIENYTQNSNDYRYIPQSLAGKKYIKPSEIAIVRYGATAGHIANGEEGVLANNLFSVRPNDDNILGKYLILYLKLPKVFRYFQSEMAGGAMPALSFSIVGRVKVTYPSVEEQEKIAGFLSTVDDKISSLQTKKELLQKYKKGVTQAIFTQKIRFSDDSGISHPEWQNKFLKEIAFKENSAVVANDLEGRGGPYKVFGASGIVTTIDTYEQSEPYLAVIKDGAGVGRLKKYGAKSSVLGTLTIIKPKEGTNLDFLHIVLQRINFKKYVIGSTIPHIYFKDYSKELVLYPSLSEQQKIADFLTSIDDKIKLTERELEQAKKFKKALLQQMFV